MQNERHAIWREEAKAEAGTAIQAVERTYARVGVVVGMEQQVVSWLERVWPGLGHRLTRDMRETE